MAAGPEPAVSTAAAVAALRCVEALTAFVESGKSLLDLAEKESGKGLLLEFVTQKVRIEQKRSLLGLIDAGAALYSSLSVTRRKEAEELWRQNHHCASLRAVLRDFRQLEVRWDGFLRRLDQELQLGAEKLDGDHRSERISPDIALVDARTGERATLGKHLRRSERTLLVLIRQFSCLLCRLHVRDLQKKQESLDARSVRVLLVSFGCQEGASHWLQETDCPYELLLDPERRTYAAFGLGASVEKVLNFGNMLLYAEYVANHMEFPRGLPSVEEDMFQLGGDFLVDRHGKVLFFHCCQSPLDRPSVEAILSAQ